MRHHHRRVEVCDRRCLSRWMWTRSGTTGMKIWTMTMRMMCATEVWSEETGMSACRVGAAPVRGFWSRVHVRRVMGAVPSLSGARARHSRCLGRRVEIETVEIGMRLVHRWRAAPRRQPPSTPLRRRLGGCGWPVGVWAVERAMKTLLLITVRMETGISGWRGSARQMRRRQKLPGDRMTVDAAEAAVVARVVVVTAAVARSSRCRS